MQDEDRRSVAAKARFARLRKGGRPRKQGPRTPSGRLSKALTTEARTAQGCEGVWKEYKSAATSGHSDPPPFDVGENAVHPLLRLVRTQNLHPETFLDAMAWLLASHPAAPTIRFRKWLSGRTGFNFRTVEGSAAARRCALGRIGVANAKLLDAATMRQDIRCSLEQLEAILREVWDAWSQHASTLPSAKHDP